MSHVELSPSSAARWLACPGSVALSRGIPERPSSAAVDEGTAAHALAERALRYAIDPLRCSIGGTTPTVEMAEYVTVYTDFCRSLLAERTPNDIEVPLSLARLNPPAPMSGTADFICHTPKRLDIVDLKYGKGVFVEAVDNPQLLYYAVMGVLWCQDQALTLPRTVRITIVQPRIEHLGETIRSVEYELDDVLGFAHTLLDGAKAALEPHAPLHVGSQCRWCPASAICPAQRDAAAGMARMEFTAITPDALPPPATLWSRDIGDILERARHLKAWVEALEQEAFGRLQRGDTVRGWKLGQTKPHRKWIDDTPSILLALQQLGLDADDILRVQPKPITEVERLLKRQKETLPEVLVYKPEPSLTLVPERDPRPAAAVNAALEFTALPHSQE